MKKIQSIYWEDILDVSCQKWNSLSNTMAVDALASVVAKSHNSLRPGDAIWRHRSESTLAQVIMLPDGTDPLPDPMLTYYLYGPVAFIWGYYHKKPWRYQSVNQDWKLHPDPQGTNVLSYFMFPLIMDKIKRRILFCVLVQFKYVGYIVPLIFWKHLR